MPSERKEDRCDEYLNGMPGFEGVQEIQEMAVGCQSIPDTEAGKERTYITDLNQL